MLIHKISNLNDLRDLLFLFKEQNYAFISYISGEYGIMMWIYRNAVTKFYEEMKGKSKKTVAFVFKNTKYFAHTVCDEIIEFQDIEFEEDIDSIPYYGNDGWAKKYIYGIESKAYDNILNEVNFENIFYTLNADGSTYSNQVNKNIDQFAPICLYKIDNQDITLPSFNYCLENFRHIEYLPKQKVKYNQIAMWIRNTNKWEMRNLSSGAYNSIFKYCIKNQIVCKVFLDFIPIDLPDNKYIIDCTDKFKGRPNWDHFIDVVNESDFYIGSASGSSDIVFYNIKIDCLLENIQHYHSSIINLINERKLQGLICEGIHFESQLAGILDSFYS